MRVRPTFLLTLPLIVCLMSHSSFAEPRPLPPIELEYLARLPNSDINIGTLALILASEIFPNLDIPLYNAQLDAMVEEIRRLTGNSTDPDYRIRVMNTYLYLDQQFHYDKEDMYGHRLTNRYLNGILDTGAGSCTTMPLLYLAIAQRLDYPVYPVAAPQHLFLRYVDPTLKEQNIEGEAAAIFQTKNILIPWRFRLKVSKAVRI